MIVEEVKSNVDLLLKLQMPDYLQFDDGELYDFCRANDSLKFERDSKGNIIIMALTGGKTGRLNMELSAELTLWNRRWKLGEVFDSSTGFRLPSGAVRSPDCAWIGRERWQALTDEQQEKFIPLCPDFVIELMSQSDSLADAQRKMQEEWLGNGCLLAWLIDVKNKTTYIYRPNAATEIIQGFDYVMNGENILKDFYLDLKVLNG